MGERSPPASTLVVRERKSRGSVEDGLAAGTMLGSYRVLSKIGEGSVGRVYLAEHTKIGRKVAIKVLREELSANTKLVRRFFDEARTVNEIAHENIVAITDFFDDGGKAHFIMELLEGQTLAQLLASERVLTITEAVSIMRQLLSALKAVHKKGIVHRDLKPANIFLARREEQERFVKLLDFGTAKLSEASDQQVRTRAGDLMGTPDYMSPEQAYAMEVDERSDIYAAGLIFYEMLTGQRAFEHADSIDETLALHRKAIPRSFSSAGGIHQVPKKLQAVVMKCLAKDPNNRYQSAAELKSDVETVAAEVIAGLQFNTMSASAQIVHVPAKASMTYLAAAIITGAVVAIAGISAVLWSTKSSKETPPSVAIPVQAPEPKPQQEPEPEIVAEPEEVAEPEPADRKPRAPAKKVKRAVKSKTKAYDESTTISPF